MLVPGTILGERYEVIEVIGTGGMANVYKAVDKKLNREIAIKVLKEEYSSNKNFVSKFKAEAQAAAGLMHPNIVNVYDVGDENGLYYFVMELVDGITLKNYIEKKIRLSVKEAVSIAIQVSMGIEAAHNKGIIHRDIKPQNIFPETARLRSRTLASQGQPRAIRSPPMRWARCTIPRRSRRAAAIRMPRAIFIP